MWRFGYDANASFILTLALLSMLGTVLVWQKNRTGKTVAVWFWAAFFGVLLGCVGTFALARVTSVVLKEPSTLEPSAPDGEIASSASAGAGEHGGKMGPPSGDMGGGMGGRPGDGMGRGPRPKRELTELVRKVALLTGPVEISLTPEQGTAFVAALQDIEKAETMTDEDAQAKQTEVLALLDDEQKSKLEAVGLPRGPRPGGGGPGGERPAADANPFGQEQSLTVLTELRGRFGGEKKGDK